MVNSPYTFSPRGVVVSSPSGDVILNAGTNMTIFPQGDMITFASTIPSNSVVTSIFNSDGTITISSPTGPSEISLNLSHSNTWTNTQNFNTGASNSVSIGDITAATSDFISKFSSTEFLISDSFYPDGMFLVQRGVVALGDSNNDENFTYITVDDNATQITINGNTWQQTGSAGTIDFGNTLDITATGGLSFNGNQTFFNSPLNTFPNGTTTVSTKAATVSLAAGILQYIMGSGFTASSGSTSTGGSVSFLSGDGGSASGTVHTSSPGGNVTFIGGTGGSATASGSANTSGNGGQVTFQGGSGGVTGGSSSGNTPGTGGLISAYAGVGGSLNSSAHTGDTAGRGGHLVLGAGAGGSTNTSSTTSGQGGDLYLSGGLAGTAVGGASVGSNGSVFLGYDLTNGVSGLVGVRQAAPFTASLDIVASTTSNASLRIRSGTAPASPNDGDMWYDGTNVKFRVGGTTKTFTLT